MKCLEEYKTEHKLFLERLNNTPIVNLNLIEYLRESINREKDKNTRCIGWDYLKTNLTEELKKAIDSNDYWKLKYNSEKEENILFYLKLKYGQDFKLNEELKSQLGSFVYVWNCIKRNLDKEEQEQNLKIKLEKEGFKEFNPINNTGKELDKLKVICCLDVNAIGFLGSFNKKVMQEGKFTYSEYNKSLMLIPKRCRTRGYLIRKNCFYKEVVYNGLPTM